jgi:hypothetical protein
MSSPAEALLSDPKYALGLEEDLRKLRGQLNGVYRERSRVVAALASLVNASPKAGKAWVAKHVPSDPDEAWDDTWQTVVYIESADSRLQFSWHFHIDDKFLLEHLPSGPNSWDGHTTKEKYERLLSWSRSL